MPRKMQPARAEALKTGARRFIGDRCSRGHAGERQRYGRAVIGGREYAWQGAGAGMYATFRAIKGERA